MITQIKPSSTIAETFCDFVAQIATRHPLIAKSAITRHVFYAGAQAAFGAILCIDATDDFSEKANHTAGLLRNIGRVKAELGAFTMQAMADAMERLIERDERQASVEE